jgi:hypothetical protein
MGAALAILWAWVALAPLAFLDQEYASFLAKRTMLESCDLGSVLVIGDSRAAADIVASRLPVPTTNLAIGGGGPVEGYFLFRRAMRCPHPPARVILSFTAQHLSHADTFWERSVRFGLVERAEVGEFSEIADRLGDHAFGDRLRDSTPDRLRAWLYAARFPALYAGSMLHAGGALRYLSNRRALERVLRSRGQYEFGTGDGSSAVAMEGWMSEFRPDPVLDYFLDRLLALAESRGVSVRFIAMPVNEATFAASSPRMRSGFAAYLAPFSARYPGFSVDPDLFPHWPDRLFGDGYSHLNARGAEIATARFAHCLETDPAVPAKCDWGRPAAVSD